MIKKKVSQQAGNPLLSAVQELINTDGPEQLRGDLKAMFRMMVNSPGFASVDATERVNLTDSYFALDGFLGTLANGAKKTAHHNGSRISTEV